MVYGQPIKLPGKFFEKPKNSWDTDTFEKDQQKQMQQLKPLESRRKSSKSVFIHKDLGRSTHVFIRIDRIRKPLEPPYNEPFLIVKRPDKYFNVKNKGKDTNVSIDRLKSAYLLTDIDVPLLDSGHAQTLPNETLTPADPETEKQPPDLLNKNVQTEKITRSGRHVRFPVRYRD
ncbi:uncharacterized protein LOC129966381 [Argiope bruennichi]|uniref:uncharacterized protein LOC129966381 n=1 Tax=Argiope bruennichi TaxID=94029 RepID=UPI0024948FDF|nr:uncharacterized protein LOC129966381 [Argiope bruennichi]